MSFQIANVLIWQKNGLLRNLEFKKNHVNVITGESGKGKSSILYIIDYCLLSSTATGISKENIDNKSDWYGIRLWTTKGVVTIARPAYHKEELKMIYFSDSGDIPHSPTLNMSSKELKMHLDKELGLNSNLVVPYGGRTIKAGTKISFRNFLPFCFQDQNTLVAPDYLYMRPGEQKVVERIERTFQMAVGILDAEGTIVNEQLEKLKAKKESLEIRNSALVDRVYVFEEDVLSLKNEAVILGLMQDIGTGPTEVLNELRRITYAPFESFTSVDQKLKSLGEEEFKVNLKLKRYREFTREYSEYQKTLKEGDESLASIEYLRKNYEEIIPSGMTVKVLDALERQLIEIKSSWKTSGDSILFADVKEQESALKNKLGAIKKQIAELKSKGEHFASPESIYRYQGKLEAKIELYSTESIPVVYNDELTDIEQIMSELEDKVKDMLSKKEFVMGELNRKINGHLENLKLKGYEKARAVFVESLKAVNLVLNGGKSIEKMRDIGSASNYLYVHLSYFMALHEVARQNNVSWMPSFLILDQVSTPYSNENADDIASLDAALTEINKFVSDMDEMGGMQVILMEHISESHWSKLGLEKFRLVDRELIGDYGLIN